MISKKVDSTIYAVEIQKEIYELGLESIKINKLEDKIKLLNMDAKDLCDKFETDTFDLITCNPPYFKYDNNSKKNKNDIKTIARHEIKITLEDIIKISRKLLKNNGSLVLVHRPERLPEIIRLMQDNNISPKRIQFIYPKSNSDCNMIIIEGTKNGNNSIKIVKPLIVHNQKGEYKKEIQKLFK